MRMMAARKANDEKHLTFEWNISQMTPLLCIFKKIANKQSVQWYDYTEYDAASTVLYFFVMVYIFSFFEHDKVHGASVLGNPTSDSHKNPISNEFLRCSSDHVYT